MLKGFRTIILNSAVALLGVWELADWGQVVSEQWSGIILLVVGILNTWLRTKTDTPVGKK